MSEYTFKPGTCPLLAAVFPLRYAIGPSLPLDLSGHNVAPLSSHFPALGKGSENTSGKPMNYTARLLRNGWLYVWQTTINMMIEFEVTGALLKETSRGGSVIDPRHKPFFMLRAGAPAMMVWSPIRWSDAQFDTAKTDPARRESVMRTFTPGVTPMSGPVQKIHESIGDYMDLDGYGWSQDPVGQTPDWLKALEDMNVCEFQTYAVIDDTWGVLQDLARLLQVQMAAFEERRKERSEDWAIAGLIRSLSESDEQVRKVLPGATRYHLLERTWKEHDDETQGYEADLRYISQLWGAWFDTLSLKSPATLATACEHFDITQPAALEALGEEFALACAGASSTSFGVKTLSKALDPDRATEKPWLIWALLGLPNQPGLSEIKRLIDTGDTLKDNVQALQKLGIKLAQALNMSLAFNKSAENLALHNPAKVTEELFTVLSPVLAAQMHKATEAPSNVTRLYMGAALSRSQQRIDLVAATPQQVEQWLNHLAQVPTQAPPGTLPLKPVASAVQEALPFFHLVPAGQVSAAGKPLTSVADLAQPEKELKNLLKTSKEALTETPLKCLVLVVAGVSFFWTLDQYKKNASIKNTMNLAGAATGIAAAILAIQQSNAERAWKAIAEATGKNSHTSREALAKALLKGSQVASSLSLVSALDVIVFGIETLEAFKAGDIDTALINAGLTIASAANFALYLRTYRALRTARAAVLAGELAAIGRGINQAPHIVPKLLGLTLLIVSGVIARLYTQDIPIEKWLKSSRFGTYPEAWSDSYEKSALELQKILSPVA
ncbi:toxin VasX [Pseudomonas sp. MWU12-2037]|uniref:toxin VasX n=1 Tax=Pseudomonas sp. MWU12-2037 TaxID=2928690 RepID=UPI00200D2755|nr:toxin VasX [Pseudomonas sp. MWU12-2037]